MASKRWWVCLVAIGLATGIAQGKSYKVDAAASLAQAIHDARAGDRIVLANGIWRDVDILFEGMGTREKPITLVAETAGKVVLAGQSRLRIAGEYLVVDGLWFKDGGLDGGHVVQFRNGDVVAKHCRLTNTAIVDYNPASDRVGYKWVSLYGSHNRVDHCYFRGQNNSGQTLVVWVEDEPNDHLIDHNYFAGRPRLDRNGGETVRVGTSGVSMNLSRTVVENNLFEHCDGELEIVSNKSCGNIYRHNTFRACKGMFTLRHGNACVVEGNFFFGDGVEKTGGVRVIGEDHQVINNYFEGLQGTGTSSAMTLVEGIVNARLNEYWQVKRALIAFNTFVNCQQVFEIGNGKGSRERVLPPEDVTFANNLAVGTAERPMARVLDTPVRVVWEGNVYWGGEMGMDTGNGMVRVDPKLAKRNGLFRPTAGSPAIGGAMGDYDVKMDIDGQMRHGTKDVGCDAQGTGEIRHRPLTAEDVGVSWQVNE